MDMNACKCQSKLYSNSADGDIDLKNAPNHQPGPGVVSSRRPKPHWRGQTCTWRSPFSWGNLEDLR